LATTKELLEKHGFKKQEEMELSLNQLAKTEYPKPVHRYRLTTESFQENLEEVYYWFHSFIRDFGFSQIEKITDVFAASEHSAFFGVAQQRLGLQQDKVSQFLATIGKMVRELFQLVRELRVLDERLSYYEDSMDFESPSRENAEITLKGTYIDMAEGGAKNPGSVYGMSRELQFTTLPDLFFSTHPNTPEEIETLVNNLDFNRKVKEVLKRKLRSFLAWKTHTAKELKTRRKFTLQYFRQHTDIIKMYMAWVKPYLRNIKRIQSETMEKSKESTSDIISAFEGSLVEVEFLAKYLPEKNKDVHAILLMHFRYRTRPTMSYQQEGYQRGPIHVGETKVTLRAYAWTNKQIEDYKKLREEEDFELIGTIDKSLKSAMDALGDEFKQYMKEAGEELSEEEEEKEKEEKKKSTKKPTVFSPFVSTFKGFGELLGINIKNKPKTGKPGEKQKEKSFRMENEESSAGKMAKSTLYATYKNFKKSHKLLSW
jgi:hypothetical protein|tara:strand:- start:823 stop:2277 length:1455 start_codon:yes stop_codon:yes gene_type:complete